MIMNKAEIVLAILDSGGWRLDRIIPDRGMTDEWNKANAWMVTRNGFPFCDHLGKRQWFGETAYDAFLNAMNALDMEMPHG